MTGVLKINDDELIREPLARQLVTGKNIMVFNIRESEKTHHLNTGNRIDYQNQLYEIMTREAVQSPISYTKFNCIRYQSE
jgi:hypothetical protein